MPELARHITTMPPSGIRQIAELSWQIPGSISLCIGEPGFPTAPHILEAARQALARDDTQYTANGGIAPLRAAIAHRQKATQGVEVAPEQVFVTAGGAQALHLALTLTVGAGDEVLVPDPGYPTFAMTTHMLQATPVPYVLRPERGFLPDPAELGALVTPRTRVLVLNSPSNPLGTVLPGALVRELVRFAREHDLWILSDECYEAFTDGVEHVSPARFDTDGRVMTSLTCSKTYGMTGLRLGALITPPGHEDTLAAAQEAIVSCVNTPTQYAALAALTGPQDAVDRARAYYRDSRLLAEGILREKGIPFLPARGAFYLWADVSHVSAGDVAAWAVSFLRERHVALAPGSAFGAGGEGWVRISLCGDRDQLAEGLGRLPAA